MWRWQQWLISLAVTVGVFWYLLSRIDLAELFSTATSMTPGYLWVFAILLLTGALLEPSVFGS